MYMFVQTSCQILILKHPFLSYENSGGTCWSWNPEGNSQG